MCFVMNRTNEEILAIIPARRGSKRLPKKNVLPLAGRPCIEWTLDAACRASQIDHVVVSSDDPVVHGIVRQYDKVSIVERPGRLGRDETSTIDVVLHALDELTSQGYNFTWLLLLQPTSPLRTCEHIDTAVAMARKQASDGLVSICRTAHPKEWIGSTNPGESLEDFFSETELVKNSASFRPSYTVNGAIYLIRTSVLRETRSFFPKKNMISYEMERRDSVDIDDKYDFEVAEWSLSARMKNSRS